MNRREEDYWMEIIERLDKMLGKIEKETHENNVMLRQIIQVINTWLSRHHQENEDDFGRNVLANLLSNMVDGKGIRQRKR